jgi:tetratricopeptide (TPR) repeat protein
MTTSPLAMLDQAELLQLAITSGRRNDAASTLSYLKEAVSRPDASAKAHFLLGAEYAEISLYERAISHMEMALQLDPGFNIARLQLGLLVLSCGDGARAESILQVTCESENPLTLFAKGLVHLIHDQFHPALDCIEQGMAQNHENPALNKNMQRIVDAIRKLPEEVRTPAGAKDEQSALRHILLSAYTGTSH